MTPGSKTTRGWDDVRGETFVQREKEEAHDYRYFPEPDLVVVEPEESWLEELRRTLPELPLAKKDRFVRELGLSEYDAGVLTATTELARYYEAVAAMTKLPKPSANWVSQGLLREIKDRGLAVETLSDFPVSPERLAELVTAVEQGTISKTVGDGVLHEMIEGGKSAGEIIREKGLAQVSDAGELERLVAEAITANPGPVADYRSGKKQAFGRIMGHIMKSSGGKANPKVVSALLEKKLAE